MTPSNRNRRWYLAAFILGTFWVSIGCTPATLSMFFLPFVDDKIPPRCKLAKKQEVTVCIVTNFASLETRSDVIPAESELAHLVAAQLRKRTQENREKVKVLPPSRTFSLNQAGDGPSLYEIGKRAKADYVVALEIQNLSLYEKNSNNMLYRGNLDMIIRVVDVTQAEGEGTILNEPYRGEYPGALGPVDAAEMNVQQFRARFLNKVAGDVARMFTAYPPEQRLDMD
jgi:hypothetical protein